jgi:anti-sigma factor RsiW
MRDPITKDDLHALADGQLDAARRIEAEEYLAQNPGAAAQLMADMYARDLLLLACEKLEKGPSPAVIAAAQRLERGFFLLRAGRFLRRMAASLALVGAGWFAHNFVAAEEARGVFAQEAHQSYETTRARAQVVSLSHPAAYNPKEISAATGITLPALPAGWVVADAEIFPEKNGQSVELAIDTKEFGRVSFFAAKPEQALAPIQLTSVQWPDATTVYWRQGAHSYALTGSVPDAALRSLAGELQAGQ